MNKTPDYLNKNQVIRVKKLSKFTLKFLAPKVGG